jgi:hypothetical protein
MAVARPTSESPTLRASAQIEESCHPQPGPRLLAASTNRCELAGARSALMVDLPLTLVEVEVPGDR